jgi:tryptophan-rich sensory protein
MNAPALISLGVTVVVAGVLFLMIFETIRLARHEPPITWFTRKVIQKFPGPAVGIALIVIFALGALSGHLIWDSGCS